MRDEREVIRGKEVRYSLRSVSFDCVLPCFLFQPFVSQNTLYSHPYTEVGKTRVRDREKNGWENRIEMRLFAHLFPLSVVFFNLNWYGCEKAK